MTPDEVANIVQAVKRPELKTSVGRLCDEINRTLDDAVVRWALHDLEPARGKKIKTLRAVQRHATVLALDFGMSLGRKVRHQPGTLEPWVLRHLYYIETFKREEELRTPHKGRGALTEPVVSGGGEAVIQAAEGALLLCRLAKEEADRLEQSTKLRMQHTKTWLLGNILPEIYQRHFGRPAGTSENADGKPDGPYVRFTRGVLGALKWDASGDAIRRALRTGGRTVAKKGSRRPRHRGRQ